MEDDHAEIAVDQTDPAVTTESQQVTPMAPPPSQPIVPRWLWRGVQVIGLVLLLVSLMVWLFYRSMQFEPEFYEVAIRESTVKLTAGGDRFETKVLELQNNARRTGQWSYEFSEEEVNGWLAVDCPSKFPELIPAFVNNPRIQIRDTEFQVVFQFKSRRVSAVVALVGDVFVAEPGGEIAVRIKTARTGLVPLPIAEVADRITRHLRRIGVGVRWNEHEGDPLALLSIPPGKLRIGKQLVEIQTISCQDGQVLIAGQSSDTELAD